LGAPQHDGVNYHLPQNSGAFLYAGQGCARIAEQKRPFRTSHTRQPAQGITSRGGGAQRLMRRCQRWFERFVIKEKDRCTIAAACVAVVDAVLLLSIYFWFCTPKGALVAWLCSVSF
jgi:hypothetical protein